MQIIPYPSRNFEKLLSFSQETPEKIQKSVANILKKVKRDGDKALVLFTRQFDKVKLSPRGLRINESKLKKARVSSQLERAARSTLKEVQSFAHASLPKNWSKTNGHGAEVGEKFDPLERIGIYIPGGSVPLVSTVFMTAAIARVAGVKEIVVCTPPPVNDGILWALNLCGVKEVYQIGGAQALAAMAYGTQSIRPVCKIFGPGNVFVTEAKRQLFGKVGVDLLAGPSELMVLADETTKIDWAVIDLLAQAEHGSGRERIFCASTSQRVLKNIAAKLQAGKSRYPRNKGLQQVLKEGTFLIQVKNQKQLVEATNALAPEHLQIMTRDSQALARSIRTAGAIFIGNNTPTPLGDFVAGPSHTLPTGGSGSSFSGLRTMDFMRRTSLVEYSAASLKRASSGVKAFADAEELPCHGETVILRK